MRLLPRFQHPVRAAFAAVAVGALAGANPAWAAPGDEGGPEEITVTTPAGKAARPDLNVRVPNFDLNTEVFTFPSGLRVMFQHDDSQPIVAVTSVTDHGASDDPLGKEGIAHLVEHLWFRSEQGELPKTWDILASELGCDLNAFTQYDITAYMTVCSGRHLDALMKLESLRITDTVENVTQEMVTTEIEVVRNEIRMRAENYNIPFFTVWEYANGHIFDETYPYHRPMAGDHTTIRNIDLEDVVQFTEDYYRPDTTTMMVVGDLPSTSPGYLLNLMTTNFDLALLHPDLKEEHLRRMPREGVENPKEDNPDDWYIVPMNPDNTNEVLPYLNDMEPRRDQFSALVPPEPVTTSMGVYEGPVEQPMVVVAWTLPAGYQGNDTLMRITGNALNWVTFMGMAQLDDPDVRSFEGCFALPSKRSTTMFCVATAKSNDANAERIASRMIDQVPQLYDPSMRANLDRAFSQARMQFMASTLRSLDLYAAVGAGRATDIAQFAHFTGNPKYHSNAILEATQLQSFQITEMSDKWLKRNRAAKLFIKPMERDEVSLLSEDTEGSGGHFRGGGDGPILNPSVDTDLLTPEYIRSLFDLPDVSKIDDFKLPNGLRVVVMPHSDAPLVQVSITANGGSMYDDIGLAEMVSTFEDFETSDPLQIAGDWMWGRGWGFNRDSVREGIKASGGNLDGALWLLRERVSSVYPDLNYLNFRGDRLYQGKIGYLNYQEQRMKSGWFNPEAIKDRLRWDHVNPGHPAHDVMTMDDLDKLKKTSTKDMQAYLNTVWQPSNATLVVVGNVSAEDARAYAIKYFGGWRPAKGVSAYEPEPIPGPNEAKDFGIYVLDDEGKTQTEVTLVCPIKPAETTNEPAYNMLSKISRTTLFAKLREEAGVVYSPFATTFVLPGGSAYIYMTAAIQNDSAVFAMEQYVDFLNTAAEGKIKKTDTRLEKLGMANGYVLDQQSLSQMTSRLMGTIERGEDWDAFAEYADGVAEIEPADFAGIVKGCADKAVVTFHGPEDGITEQLEEGEYEFTVIDPEEEGERVYEEQDPKGFKKYMKRKEKREAKKKKDGDDEEEEEESESDEDSSDEDSSDEDSSDED